MECGKYIIVEQRGCELAIMFDSILVHADIARPYRHCVISAGFFGASSEPTEKDPDDIDVGVWGKSETLKLEVRKNKDERLIKRVIRPESGF